MSGSVQLARFREFGKKIIGFGRTYSDHAKELNHALPTEPIIFLKPTTAYVTEGHPIKLPKGTTELHHEVELGIVIGKTGFNISESSAMDHIGGYCLILDMTDRIGQSAAAKAGLCWSLAKGFDTSCPTSEFIPKEKIPDPQDVDLWLKVNGVQRQHGNTKDMVFKIPHLVSWVSQYFTLEPGDLLLTGTPAGVGPVRAGDKIECGLGKELMSMQFSVVSQ